MTKNKSCNTRQTASSNPWRGPVPYTEKDRDSFLGRDNEVNDLLRIVEGNVITTLYGRSGIGKSSLIRAGLAWQLSEKGYTPVILRLDNKPEHKAYHQQIIDSLEEYAQPSTDLPKASQNEEALWDYFAYHSFKKADGKTTIPVIIIDQFEEVLRKRHTDDDLADAVLLLKQLRNTLQDATLIDGTPYRIRFRILLSMREDDLCLLEDMLDQHYIDNMKRERYRLRPLNRVNAEKIILERGVNFEKGKEKEIADFLIRQASPDGQISTILLSIACSQAYESKYSQSPANSPITLKDLEAMTKDDDLIMKFYTTAISGISNRTMKWIEESFVDGDRRRFVKDEEIPPMHRAAIDTLRDQNNPYRLLTASSESGNSIELLHDRLAVTMSNYRQKRQERHARRWFLSTAIFILIALITLPIVKPRIGVKPMVFDPKAISHDDTIAISLKGYVVEDSVLELSHCTVLPYTFYGNTEVTSLKLDSVTFYDNSFYLPNVTELVIGGDQYAIGTPKEESLPNLSHIVVHRPNTAPSQFRRYKHLETVTIATADSNYLHWNHSTLIGRHDTSYHWNAIAAQDQALFDTNEISNCSNATPLYTIDLARTKQLDLDNSAIMVKLTCSDSNIKTITKEYLQKKKVPIDKVFMIDFDYVENIDDSAFFNNKKNSWSTKIKYLNSPRLKRVGTYAFYNSQLQTIDLPNLEVIEERAFWQGNNNIKNLHLDAIDTIKQYSFNIQKCDNVEAWWNESARIELCAFNFNNETPANHQTLVGQEGNKNIEPESGSKSQPYYVERGTIRIDSLDIDLIEIGDSIEAIITSTAMPQIDRIKLDKSNEELYIWHGDLYKGDRVLLQTNRERYVALPPEFKYDRCITGHPHQHKKAKEIVILNRERIDDIFKNYSGHNITILVPHGQKDFFSHLERSDRIASVEELSIIETIYYTKIYGKPHPSKHLLYKAWNAIWSFCVNALPTHLAGAVLSLFIALMAWQLFTRRWNHEQRFKALVYIISGYLITIFAFIVIYPRITLAGIVPILRNFNDVPLWLPNRPTKGDVWRITFKIAHWYILPFLVCTVLTIQTIHKNKKQKKHDE